jgi:hypothetical protein
VNRSHVTLELHHSFENRRIQLAYWKVASNLLSGLAHMESLNVTHHVRDLGEGAYPLLVGYLLRPQAENTLRLLANEEEIVRFRKVI